MPVYEYLCEKCGHEFEREQRITEDPVKVCPKCRAQKVRRLISRTAFVLKGGGWYSDLYASAKPGAEAKEAGGETKSEPAPAAADSNSESKPEPKPAAKPKKAGKKAKSS
jgi:putative FmdB family regulatory protein